MMPPATRGNSETRINRDGEAVLAVHYMGNSSTRQAFGISKTIAEDVVNTLKNRTKRRSDWCERRSCR